MGCDGRHAKCDVLCGVSFCDALNERCAMCVVCCMSASEYA